MSEAISTQKWVPERDAKPVCLTDTAIAHVKKEICKRGSGIGLRIAIKKSGCSGYAYDPQIISEVAEDDISFPCDGNIKLVVSKEALPYVQGMEIDFVRDGLNSVFKFNNPNETSSCGCGESFTVDE